MSADNWAICPQCKINRESELFQAEDAVRNSYGVMPEEEWLALRSEAVKQRLQKLEATLAEYLNPGFFEKNPDGAGYIFSIKYHGKCDVCGFKFEFEYKELVNLIYQPEKPTVQTSTDQHESDTG